jgi:hypothetical protein
MEQREINVPTGEKRVGTEGEGCSRGFFPWAARSVSLGNGAAVSVCPVYAKLWAG